MRLMGAALAVFVLGACAPEPAQVAAPDRVDAVEAGDVPAEVAALAQQTIPGFRVTEAERKERDGRVYFDVEGVDAAGAEVELDMLQTADGWVVVETQRDIAWADAPSEVRAAAAGAPNAFEPVRVIESTQTEDGAVIYELFAAGRAEAPSMEVRVANGAVNVMTTANPH